MVAQPDGLAGEDIPHESRIILARNAGTQFDVRIAEALVGRLDGRREPRLAAVDP